MLLLRLVPLKNINSNAHTALHINHRDVGVGRKLLGGDACIKSGIKSIGCNKRVIQFITVILYKLNGKDALFAISKENENFTFTLNHPYLMEIKSPRTP